MSSFTIHHGDCLDILPTIPESSVDSIVTDPPYGLSFMGKQWDHGVPGEPFWREALRVAKPGAFLLAFGGTRTFHRLTCAIEDAGWEIRDCIMWVYGSGFPKSHDVSKAIDREAGLRGAEGVGFTVAGFSHNPDKLLHTAPSSGYTPPPPISDNARKWQGWGTALKPAWEPIILARKPLIGTVADNVLKYGTGGMNVDGCRVGTFDSLNGGAYCGDGERASMFGLVNTGKEFSQPSGRWPANLIHDGSDEVVSGFPQTKSPPSKMGFHNAKDVSRSKGAEYGHETLTGFGDSGSASRFFYCAKASKADREEMNNHPTVKPTELMRYLCRLVTQPGGTVLDPFMGSGSTGKASMMEGLNFIGCDLSEEYCKIANDRISGACTRVPKNALPSLIDQMEDK